MSILRPPRSRAPVSAAVLAWGLGRRTHGFRTRPTQSTATALGFFVLIGLDGCVLPGAEGLYDDENLELPTQSPAEIDGDGDGVLGGLDCDDAEPTVYPGAIELCDGLDNDCDGAASADETDNDADQERVCAGDCNDSDPDRSTAAMELCDGLDQDCDGVIDDGASDCPCDQALRDSDGSSFLFCSDAALTWGGARDACDALGYHLALPRNEGEMTFLTYEATTALLSDFWLALSDAQIEQAWMELDGSPPIYVDWAPLEPSPTDGADCLQVPLPGPGTWRAVDCGGAADYVCEARGEGGGR